MLTCDNLYFRRPTQDDAVDICELKNNEKAAKLLGGIYHPYTVEDIEKWIDFHNNNPEEVLLVIEDIVRSKLIGHVGLYKIDHVAKKAEYGLLLADDNSRGKGYGTKTTKTIVEFAFNRLGMHKITCEILSENTASIVMCKKCGFSIDGCLRDDVFKNDRYYDVLCMSILESEHRK